MDNIFLPLLSTNRIDASVFLCTPYPSWKKEAPGNTPGTASRWITDQQLVRGCPSESKCCIRIIRLYLKYTNGRRLHNGKIFTHLPIHLEPSTQFCSRRFSLLDLQEQVLARCRGLPCG